MTTVLVPSVIYSSLFIPDLRPRRKETIFLELVDAAHRSGAVRDRELLLETLLRREHVCGSAIGKGVAVPNARSLAVVDARLVVARSLRGVDWGAPDRAEVQLIVLALSTSESSEEAHHDLVGRAVAATRHQRNRQKLLDATGLDAVAALMREALP